MSGMLLCIVPPTVFNFDNLIGTIGKSVSVPIAQRIDTSGYESGVLQVRVHSVNLTGADTITVTITPHGYTPDDPGLDFGSVGTVLQTITVTDGNAPDYQNVALTTSNTPFGNLLRINVNGNRLATQTTVLNAKLSIDLTLKTGGAARPMTARMPGAFLGYG